jgi:hypothetical protein
MTAILLTATVIFLSSIFLSAIFLSAIFCLPFFCLPFFVFHFFVCHVNDVLNDPYERKLILLGFPYTKVEPLRLSPNLVLGGVLRAERTYGG